MRRIYMLLLCLSLSGTTIAGIATTTQPDTIDCPGVDIARRHKRLATDPYNKYVFEHRIGNSFYRAHDESNATEAMYDVVRHIVSLAKDKKHRNK